MDLRTFRPNCIFLFKLLQPAVCSAALFCLFLIVCSHVGCPPSLIDRNKVNNMLIMYLSLLKFLVSFLGLLSMWIINHSLSLSNALLSLDITTLWHFADLLLCPGLSQLCSFVEVYLIILIWSFLEGHFALNMYFTMQNDDLTTHKRMKTKTAWSSNNQTKKIFVFKYCQILSNKLTTKNGSKSIWTSHLCQLVKPQAQGYMSD